MFNIRPIEERDITELLNMIEELAIYEDMQDMLKVDEHFIKEHILPPESTFDCFVLIAEDNPEELIGYAALYTSMSLFLGACGWHLHDLYVRKAYRGKGIGKFVFVKLAQIAADRNYGRITWEVLNWNSSAIEFYRKLGATHMHDWDMFKLEGHSITALANSN